MRGERLLKALDIIETLTCNTAGFMEAFLSSSKSKYLPLLRFRPRIYNSMSEGIRKDVKEKQERQRIYDLISRLQEDGLIEKSKPGRWLITARGRLKKDKLKSELANRLPDQSYKTKPSKEIIIFSFDIPEKLRNRRNWLRSTLKNIGLSMLQKSVWLGKVIMPKDFMEDLKKLQLLNYIEIFTVGKAGTIKQVV